MLNQLLLGQSLMKRRLDSYGKTATAAGAQEAPRRPLRKWMSSTFSIFF